MEIILLNILGVIVGFLGLMSWARNREAAAYNGGFCTECPDSPMIGFDTDSQGGRGYRCDQCHHRIWVSYGVDR